MSDNILRKRRHEVQKKIDSLSLRERGLVLLSAIAIVYMLWDFAIYAPLSDSKLQVDRAITSAEQRINSLEQEESTLLQAMSSDPDKELKALRDELLQRVEVLDNELGELANGLVPADQLANILQEVLMQTGVLKLQLLQTLPVQELELTAIESSSEGAVNSSAGVYKHTVALTITGQYFQLLDYVKKLEGLSWRFYWDELHFEREDYPNGIIYLRVYTLSTEEGLLGV